jgi:SAM-dependent methyltransferase
MAQMELLTTQNDSDMINALGYMGSISDSDKGEELADLAAKAEEEYKKGFDSKEYETAKGNLLDHYKNVYHNPGNQAFIINYSYGYLNGNVSPYILNQFDDIYHPEVRDELNQRDHQYSPPELDDPARTGRYGDLSDEAGFFGSSSAKERAMEKDREEMEERYNIPLFPENKRFLQNFHDEVVSSDSELVEDGMTTTMRITGVGINGKEYLLPSYDPESKTILDSEEVAEKFMPLIESGEIEGYDSPEEAEEDRKKFYDDIVEEKNEGGLMSVEEDETNFFTDNRDTIEDAAYFAASLAPVTGEAISAKEAVESFEQGDYGMATLSAAGAIPGLGLPARMAKNALKAPKWFKASDAVPDTIPAPEKAQLTQINTKIYDKVENFFSSKSKKESVLDYGAGHGHGAAKLKADSYEPFPKDRFVGGSPTFTSSADIPSESYDKIVNTYVLNVVPKEIRDGLVSEMGRILKPGGEAVIITRGSDVFGSKARPVKAALGPEQGSVILAKGTYQKGFTPSELKEYASDVLGDDFTADIVSTTGTSPGIRITKAKGKYKGGLMKEPEELYHGGMMSDCGPMSTTEIVVGFDPESGNEVPLGSSAKNVRDDLDAVLSDGEYVLPADVVKWHGLKHIQGMHVEAEMGLMSMAMDDLVPTDYDMEKDEVKDMKDNGGYVLDQKAKPLEAEKVTQEPNTKKGKKIKTPDGESITVAAVDTTDTPTKVKEEDKKYASKVKGNLKAFNEGGLAGKKSFPDLNDDGKVTQADILKGRGVFYGGGLMEKKGFAEGGNPFALEDNALMMQQYEDSDEQERLRELEERYAREEDLTASEVDEMDSLRNPDREDSSQDVADSVVEDADAEVDVELETELSDTPAQDAEKFKDLEPNDVAKALMKAAQSYGGSEDEYSAFQTGIAGGMQMFDVGQKVGDKLSNFSFEKGGETVTPFAFLRDDEGFFRRRKD